MLSSAQLKQIVTEARPLIERQLEIAEQIAGLRDVVAAAGGDWSQLKALIKAQIQDERDESPDGKRVQKILDRADYAVTYADMLGLSAFAKMNEENFSDDPATKAKRSAALDALAAMDAEIIDAETGEVTEREAPVTGAAVGASPAFHSAAAAEAANANGGGDDVAPPPAHAPEQPGTDNGSVNPPAEGGAHSAPINTIGFISAFTAGEAIEPQHGLRADTAAQTVQPHAAVVNPEALAGSVESSAGGSGDDNTAPAPHTEPVTAAPPAVTEAGDRSAASPSAAPVADHSKPNPICRDPDDCGVYASWHLPCRACLKSAEAAA